MIKFLIKLILWIVTLIIIAVIGCYFYAGEIIKSATTKFVPEITKTDVQLSNVDISLFKGTISLSGLKIGNPKGFKTEEAFSLKNITVQFQPKTIMENKIIIDQVIIDGTHVTAEAQIKDGTITSNLTTIQNNVNAYLNKGNKNQKEAVNAKKEETKKAQNTSKSVVIRDLQINNSTITVSALNQVLDVPLPNIQQKNIGEQGKKTDWKETIAYIMNLISVESLKATANGVQEIMKKTAQGAIDEAKKAVEGVNNNAKEIIKSVKDLF